MHVLLRQLSGLAAALLLLAGPAWGSTLGGTTLPLAAAAGGNPPVLFANLPTCSPGNNDGEIYGVINATDGVTCDGGGSSVAVCECDADASTWVSVRDGNSGGAPTFTSITSGTNTGATMTVDTGATVEATNLGVIEATGLAEDFVALGAVDGGSSATNLTAWNAAMAAVDVAGCPVLHIPPGTFDIATGRTKYTPTNCMNIKGAGAGVSIIDFQGDTDSVFDELGRDVPFRVEGVTFRNNDQSFLYATGVGATTYSVADCSVQSGALNETCRDTDDNAHFECLAAGGCPATAWTAYDNFAGDIVIKDNHFDDFTAAGLSWCVVNSVSSGDYRGYSSLVFENNKVTGSNCALKIVTADAAHGRTVSHQNLVTGIRGSLGFSVGDNGNVDQGPVVYSNNTVKDCNPQGSADFAIFRSEGRQVTATGNNAEDCTNPSGDWEGMFHIQGNPDSISIVGNTGKDLGLGATTCEAGLVQLKGTSGEYAIVGNVLNNTGTDLCPGINVAEAGGVIANNLIIGANKLLNITVADDSAGLLVIGNLGRNLGSTPENAIEARVSDDVHFIGNVVDGLTRTTGSIGMFDIRCADTTGTCTGLVVDGNTSVGTVSSSGGDEYFIRFGLAGNNDFTEPVITNNRAADVEFLLYGAATPTDTVISPRIEGNTIEAFEGTTLMNSNLTAQIVTSPVCTFPDVDGLMRPFFDVDCDGVKEAGEHYLGGGGIDGIADTELIIGTGAGTANYAAMSGDATLANTGALTIAAGAVSGGVGGKIADSTITAEDFANDDWGGLVVVGNTVAIDVGAITGSNQFATGVVDSAAIFDGTVAFGDMNVGYTLAGNPAFAAGQVHPGTNGLLFEGAADTIEGLLQWSPTTTDKTITLPNVTGTVSLIGATETLTGKTLSGAIATGSFAIPQGTAPVVDADGEIGFDSSDQGVADYQLVVADDAGTARSISDVFQHCTTIESLAAADDDKPIWMNSAYTSVTLISASCNCIGTCTTEADLALENDDGSAAAITGTVDCEDTTTGDTNTALSGAEATIDLNDVVRFDVSNTPSPETDDYIVCLNLRPVRQ